MGVGDEQLGQEIVVVGRHADPALAAAALLAIGRERRALDVAEPRHGDDHVLALDQVLDVELVVLALLDRRAPGRREARLDREQLLLEHLEQPLARAQDLQELLDALAELGQLVVDPPALELGQALQAQVEDRLGLALGQPVGVVGADRRGIVRRLLGEVEQGCDVAEPPVACGELGLGGRRIGCAADQRDHLVDVGDRDREAEQGMRPRTRLGEIVGGAPRDHLLAELEEGAQHLHEVELRRPAAGERHEVDAEADLQRRVAEQLVEHDVGVGIALELDHHASAVAIALVAQVGDALEPALAHQFADALEHARLVDLDRGSRSR